MEHTNTLCGQSLSLSLILRPTVSRPVYLGIKHPSGALTITVLFLWGDLSDERMGPSFVYAAGPCQRSLSWARVSLDSLPYFTVSDLRLPFPSPPTTRRVTVEVFDPASTRACVGSMQSSVIYTNSVRTSQETHYVSSTKTNRLMLFREITTGLQRVNIHKNVSENVGLRKFSHVKQ
jgi:hypothetical protein